jgi:SAM-dependent methyltransferase
MLARLSRKISKLSGKLKRSLVKRGRVAALLQSVPADAAILEIGGGYNPRYVKATHPNVFHLDHGTQDELRAKYAAFPTMRAFVGKVQPIDFVFDGRPIETLVPAVLRFDVIYGSHVLEHQVDLIGHLQSLEKLLKPGGRVIEMIPDLRTCFDALRFPTVTADALVVHRRAASVHQGKQVFDGMSRELDRNHGYRMRAADFDGASFAHSLRQAHEAMRAAELPGAQYQDIHAWTFTPESFRLLMIELRLLGLIHLAPTYVSPQYGNQFCAVLERVDEGSAGSNEMSPAVLKRLEKERFALARQLRI